MTWTECLYSTHGAGTTLSGFTSEASLLGGLNGQPYLYPGFWDQGFRGQGKGLVLEAQGVVSSTGTPTYTFQVRMGSTQGSASLGGTSIGVSAAITTASGVTNKWWKLYLALFCTTSGQGTGNTTLDGAGYVMSPGGFASPFVYPLEPTTPDTATWTATFDSTLSYYVNLSVTCSANSGSNAITLKQLYALGLN